MKTLKAEFKQMRDAPTRCPVCRKEMIPVINYHYAGCCSKKCENDKELRESLSE